MNRMLTSVVVLLVGVVLAGAVMAAPTARAEKTKKVARTEEKAQKKGAALDSRAGAKQTTGIVVVTRDAAGAVTRIELQRARGAAVNVVLDDKGQQLAEMEGRKVVAFGTTSEQDGVRSITVVRVKESKAGTKAAAKAEQAGETGAAKTEGTEKGKTKDADPWQ